jgi:diaminopimelate epimerase
MVAIAIPFVKMSGAGNDFVVIDNMDRRFQIDAALLARSICDRHHGIGSDGLIILEPTTGADFRMMYYNADGTYGGMCGNGGRCSVLLAHRKGYTEKRFSCEAVGHVYTGTIDGNRVQMQMKDPAELRDEVAIVDAPDGFQKCCYIDTGSPHAVFFVADLESVDVPTIGKTLREHEVFAPQGANINFVEILGESRIRMRTFERGVEAETLACGTGAIASSVQAARLHGLRSPLSVETRSRQTLEVCFERSGTRITKVMLSGEASIVFEGKVLIDLSSMKIAPQ